MRRLLAFLLLPLLVSGCMGGDGAKKDASPTIAAHPQSSGRVDGIAYDTEFNPLAGVNVSLSTHATTFKTNQRGEFTIPDVEPGDHELRADLAGYRSSRLRFTVSAGEVLEVRLELEPIPQIVAYSELIVYKAHMTLGIATPLYAVRPGLDVQDQLVFSRNTSDDARSLVAAITWTVTFPGGASRFQLDSILDGQLYNQTIGPSPMLNRVDQLQVFKNPRVQHSIWLPRTCDYYTTATCIADPPDTLFAIAVDQRFDLYSTVFYGGDAPLDYSGLPE